jgi:hypothetical protein
MLSCEQRFWASSQSSVVHALVSAHGRVGGGTQAPAWQVSAPLQNLPSPHAVSSATLVCVQPRAGSHRSVVQGLPSSQLGARPAVHEPRWQVSSPLHALASAQDVPPGFGAVVQTRRVSSHEAVLHAVAKAVQLGVPPVQTPLRHESAMVQ